MAVTQLNRPAFSERKKRAGTHMTETPRQKFIRLIKQASTADPSLSFNGVSPSKFVHATGKDKGKVGSTYFARAIGVSTSYVNGAVHNETVTKPLPVGLVAAALDVLRTCGCSDADIMSLTASPETQAAVSAAEAARALAEPLEVKYEINQGWWSRERALVVTSGARGHIARAARHGDSDAQFEVAVTATGIFPAGTFLHCVSVDADSEPSGQRYRVCLAQHPSAGDLWRVMLKMPDEISKRDTVLGVVIGAYRAL